MNISREAWTRLVRSQASVVALTQRPIVDGGLVHTGVLWVTLATFVRMYSAERTQGYGEAEWGCFHEAGVN